MKKLSTHIKGLDALFHGGIQVTSVTSSMDDIQPGNASKLCTSKNCNINTCKLYKENQSSISQDMRDRDGLIIIIRGSRGVNKHLFAMQLMHGLGMSIYDVCQDNQENKYENFEKVVEKFDKPNNDALRYYSINKPTHLLEDMYLDLLIERWISHTNIEYKELLLKHNGNATIDNESKKILGQRTERILNTLFVPTRDLSSGNLDIVRLFAENIIGYNARTNSIHFRTTSENDDVRNRLFRRKYDSLKEYQDENFLASYHNNPCEYYNFKSEFLNVKFNAHLCNISDKDAKTNKQDNTSENKSSSNADTYKSVRNAHSARVNFFSILNNIENALEEKEDRKENIMTKTGSYWRENHESSKYACEVLVIDGFSHISEKDLQSLPYNHLLNCLRKYARISILVFEDSQTTMPDGDIEIEIRSNYDESEDYTYNELRIAKCVHQVASLGWHLYKRQESHIRIYPSLHLNLFKRSYINNQMHELGRSILKDSYMMQVRCNKVDNKEDSEYPAKYINEILNTIDNNSKTLFNSVFAKAKKLNCVNDESNRNENDSDVLKNILLGHWQKEDDPPQKLHTHCPIMTIVGNLNSHKRNLALYSAFSKAHEKNSHVLIVLLDKDPVEMRKKILCPSLISNAGKVDEKKTKECLNCYNSISFLNVNSGCITPEEFLSMLKDHILVYTGAYKDRIKDNKDKRRHLHIIFDDYHRIDFSYPFLSSSNLFTTALISLCEKMNVGLTILCDKDSKRVREVCTLSDYVLCVQREEKDTPRKVTLYTERNGDDLHSGTIFKAEISDALSLMECGEKVKVKLKATDNIEQIGSMKEYWRQKYNTFQQAVQSNNKKRKNNKKKR